MAALNPFMEALTTGKRPIQASLWSPSLHYAELIAAAGYDAVLIDLQHGSPTDVGDLYALGGVLRARGVAPIVRVPNSDPAFIGRVLDLGMAGVIGPDVKSVEEARQFVAACNYPPEGARGFGSTRAQALAPDTFSTMGANQAVMVIVQIESPIGLDNVEEIVATPGVHGVFPGMVDYALEAFGQLLPGLSFLDERVRQPLERIIEAAHAAGKYVGLPAASLDEIGSLLNLGTDWILIGSDRGWIGAGARKTVAGARTAIKEWAGA